MQGEALFDIRKHPSLIEKGVPLILEYYYLYSCIALLCKQIAVFTPLSIRRGDGGEAVSLNQLTASPSPSERRGCVPPSASFYLKESPLHVKRAFPCNEKGVPSH